EMTDENVPALAPTRSDDQILPFAAWVPIGKSNYVLDLQKKQKNLIFQISVDILQHTNFFRAFTASASVPAIYIQQFWNTLTYEAKTGVCSFKLDEARFVLDANLLREALQITPIDQAHQFVSPPSGEGIMDFEEFVQAIQTFLTDKANLGSPTKKGRKDKAYVIPYCRFTKLIICHLERIYNIHQRSTYMFHLDEEDLRLSNLKFVPKGEEDELVDEPDEEPAAHSEPEPEPVHQGEGEEFDMERVIQMSLESFQAHRQAHVGGVAIRELIAEATRPLPVVEGKGKAIVTEEQAAQSLWTPTTEEASTRPSAQPLDNTSANIVHDSSSSADAETCARSDKTNSRGDTEILQITKELGEDVDKQENIEEKTVKLDQDQVGSDPGETHESQPPPEQVLMDEDQAGPDPGISRVALAGPDLEPTYDEFMADLYPKVQKSLKFSADEHVILEDPLSSTETLSSMKNLDDAYAIGDQFINDKSTDDELGKLNVEAKVVSMVTVLIYQASSPVPPLSTPQSTTESELAERVTALKKKLSDLEQNNKNLNNTTQNLGSRVYTLELRDLPHKINEAVRENVKEAVKIALQAPLRDRFRDLSEEDMKEMLHQRMFESGTYKSLPEHIALYKALEASIAQAQRDEFLAEKDKSHKRCRDDQDPPPLPDSDLSKRRRHDTGAYGSSQPQAP
ncbi:hypothetical protein Tco_1305780, partial [Tanacetum coccineum]